MKKHIVFALSIFIFLLACVPSTQAFERKVIKAEVIDITTSGEEIVFDDFSSFTQTLLVELKEGENAGDLIEIENDYAEVKKGDSIYVTELPTEDGTLYSLYEINRIPTLIIFLSYS